MWYERRPFVKAIFSTSYISLVSLSPSYHFRCCQFRGGDDVAVAADALKPPKRTTSGLRLDAREVVIVGATSKPPKMTTSSSHLDAREVAVVGGTSKWRNEPPPARIWTRGRWWWWDMCQNAKMGHVQLAFGREGGGSGGVRIEMLKRTTSGSRLDAREVVVVGFALKC